MISYPGATANNKSAKHTVAYHGKINVLKKNKIVKKILYIIVVQSKPREVTEY